MGYVAKLEAYFCLWFFMSLIKVTTAYYFWNAKGWAEYRLIDVLNGVS